nr:hypothetical protein CFP56_12287 [Quercus suber]
MVVDRMFRGESGSSTGYVGQSRVMQCVLGMVVVETLAYSLYDDVVLGGRRTGEAVTSFKQPQVDVRHASSGWTNGSHENTGHGTNMQIDYIDSRI